MKFQVYEDQKLGKKIDFETFDGSKKKRGTGVCNDGQSGQSYFLSMQ